MTTVLFLSSLYNIRIFSTYTTIKTPKNVLRFEIMADIFCGFSATTQLANSRAFCILSFNSQFDDMAVSFSYKDATILYTITRGHFVSGRGMIMTSLLVVLLQNVANWMKEWGGLATSPATFMQISIGAFVVQSSSLKDPTYMRFISLPWFFLAGYVLSSHSYHIMRLLKFFFLCKSFKIYWGEYFFFLP